MINTLDAMHAHTRDFRTGVVNNSISSEEVFNIDLSKQWLHFATHDNISRHAVVVRDSKFTGLPQAYLL